MRHLDLIKKLDYKSDRERLQLIIAWLDHHPVTYRLQEYDSGTNLIVDLGHSLKRTGISSHFDIVERSGGANDNGSAIAVCLNIIERYIQKGDHSKGLRIFFFDEEETGLKGSEAYIEQYGIADLTGLINLELVGMGNKLALWPLNQSYHGKLLTSFEQSARAENTAAIRFDKIVTNTADHLSFREAGLTDAFTVTCISDEDIQAAELYYKALQRNTTGVSLYDLLHRAPVFMHYHKPSDTWEKLEESAMERVASVIWRTVA